MLSKLLRPFELALRHFIVYPSLRLVLGNKSHSDCIDLKLVRKMLIFRQDRIGDMVITTPLLRKFKKVNPGMKLVVLASPLNADIIKYNPHVDRIIIRQSGFLPAVKQIMALRREKFDVLLNLIFNRTTTIGILARLVCPRSIKISQGPEKYSFYFNHFLTLERGRKHMGELYIELAEQVFNIRFKPEEFRYQIFLPPDVNEQIDRYLGKQKSEINATGKKYIVFNISATVPRNSLSARQIIKILKYLTRDSTKPVIMISAPGDNGLKKRLHRNVGSSSCFLFPVEGSADLLSVAALIKQAAFVITPDTAIVHVASATKTPVISMYTPLQYPAEWFPFRVDNITLMADPGQPVAKIDIKKIFSAIDSYVTRFMME